MRTQLDVSQASDSQKVEMLKYAAETRRFEIERFWQRSLFFWGFIASAFIAYFALASSRRPEPLLLLLIACFGTVSSFAWTLLNRGSKYWQVAWETKLKLLEMDVLGVPLFSNIEPYEKGVFWGPARYSTSKLAIALSDFTTAVWVILALSTFRPPTAPAADMIACFLLGGTAVYLTCLFLVGRSGQGSG